ncbi:hypothetical protein GCM10020258_32500 [Sphingomonas yabuuchiae]
MMKGYAKTQALQNSAVRTQPFLAKRDCGVQDVRIGGEERTQCATLMQIDNDFRERLDAPPLRTEYKNRLTIIDKPPSSRQAEFALVVGKETGSAALRRNQ